MFKLFGRRNDDDRISDGPDLDEDAVVAQSFSSRIAEVQFIGNTAVATLTVTDLTFTGSGHHLSELLDQLEQTGSSRFVLDTQNVQMIDSSTLGCMVDACNRLAKRGGRIAIANAAIPVQQAVRLTRLDRLFPICQDVMAAMATVERNVRAQADERWA